MPRHELLDILLIYFYYINRKGNDREQVAAMPLLERTGGWCEPVEGQAGEYIPGAARWTPDYLIMATTMDISYPVILIIK